MLVATTGLCFSSKLSSYSATVMTWFLLSFSSDRPDAWNAGCQLPEAATANGSLTAFGLTSSSTHTTHRHTAVFDSLRILRLL